jgi:mono/diheme cytochrome c family protein
MKAQQSGRFAFVVMLAALLLPACQPGQSPAKAAALTDAQLLTRGDYLVRIAGCNDCHTPGYMDQQGNVDKSLWLTGNQLGFNGPWGTTYPSNLRLRMAGMDEKQWLAYSADLHTRPMMPDFAVRAMHEDDRRAIYRFNRSLGGAGEPAPAYLPPGQQPPPPYVQLVLPAQPAPPAGPEAPAATD